MPLSPPPPSPPSSAVPPRSSRRMSLRNFSGPSQRRLNTQSTTSTTTTPATADIALPPSAAPPASASAASSAAAPSQRRRHSRGNSRHSKRSSSTMSSAAAAAAASSSSDPFSANHMLRIPPAQRTREQREQLAQWLTMQKIACFAGVHRQQMFQLAGHVTFEEFQPGDTVFTQNDACVQSSKFYVLLLGSASVWINNPTAAAAAAAAAAASGGDDDGNAASTTVTTITTTPSSSSSSSSAPHGGGTVVDMSRLLEVSAALANNSNRLSQLSVSTAGSSTSTDPLTLTTATTTAATTATTTILTSPRSRRHRRQSSAVAERVLESLGHRTTHHYGRQQQQHLQQQQQQQLLRRAEVQATRTFVATLQHTSRKNYFGELGLMYGKPRGATIKAETPMKCLTVMAPVFRSLLRQPLTQMIDDVTQQLATFDALSTIHRASLRKIALYVNFRLSPRGQQVLKTGDSAHELLLLTEGECVLSRYVKESNRTINVATMCPGSIVGDYELATQRKHYVWTVTATQQCKFFVLRLQDFVKRAGADTLQQLAVKATTKHAWRVRVIKDNMRNGDIHAVIDTLRAPNPVVDENIVSGDMLPSIRRRRAARVQRRVLPFQTLPTNKNGDDGDDDGDGGAATMAADNKKGALPPSARSMSMFGADFNAFSVPLDEAFRLLSTGR